MSFTSQFATLPTEPDQSQGQEPDQELETRSPQDIYTDTWTELTQRGLSHREADMHAGIARDKRQAALQAEYDQVIAEGLAAEQADAIARLKAKQDRELAELKQGAKLAQEAQQAQQDAEVKQQALSAVGMTDPNASPDAASAAVDAATNGARNVNDFYKRLERIPGAVSKGGQLAPDYAVNIFAANESPSDNATWLDLDAVVSES